MSETFESQLRILVFKWRSRSRRERQCAESCVKNSKKELSLRYEGYSNSSLECAKELEDLLAERKAKEQAGMQK